jgi:hypothetical protein
MCAIICCAASNITVYYITENLVKIVGLLDVTTPNFQFPGQFESWGFNQVLSNVIYCNITSGATYYCAHLRTCTVDRNESGDMLSQRLVFC